MKQRGLGFFPQRILIISTPYRDINRALKLFGSPRKPVALAESDLPGQLGHASGCPQSRYFHPDPFTIDSPLNGCPHTLQETINHMVTL